LDFLGANRIVDQGVKPKPDLVIAEHPASGRRPVERVLAFVDVLLRFDP
jgi:hypothetical protein